MKRLVIIAVLASGLASSPAWAQLSLVSGWGSGLHPGSASTGLGPAGWAESPAYGEAGNGISGVGLRTAYELSPGSRYQLGLGLAMGYGYARTATAIPVAHDQSLRQRNLYALYAEPGYTLGAATLLYGKVSYLGGRGEELYVNPSFGGPNAGLSLGGGMRTMLGEGLYLQFELVYGDYEWQGMRAVSLRPASATGSIGLGWRF